MIQQGAIVGTYRSVIHDLRRPASAALLHDRCYAHLRKSRPMGLPHGAFMGIGGVYGNRRDATNFVEAISKQ